MFIELTQGGDDVDHKIPAKGVQRFGSVELDCTNLAGHRDDDICVSLPHCCGLSGGVAVVRDTVGGNRGRRLWLNVQ